MVWWAGARGLRILSVASQWYSSQVGAGDFAFDGARSDVSRVLFHRNTFQQLGSALRNTWRCFTQWKERYVCLIWKSPCWRVRELLWCSVPLGSPWDIARNLGLFAAGLLCCAAEQFRLFVNPVCWGGQRLSTTSLNTIWNWFLEINMKKKILGKCQDETF